MLFTSTPIARTAIANQAEHTAVERSRSFHMLDVLRGIAAISVITIHFQRMFFPFVANGAYLAVDLFFVMSGFVLSHAYDKRLQGGMNPVAFLTARLIRLYPFYILALVPSFIELAYTERGAHLWWQVGLSGVFNLAMLPSPPVGIRYDPLFPGNFAAWSLAFELLANAIYGFGFRFLSAARLRLLVGLSGAILLGVALVRGNLNGGAYWPDVPVAVVRVIFSFFLGVLIHRAREAGRLPALRVPAVVPIVVTLLALGWPVPHPVRGLFDAACALVIFPLVVVASVTFAPRPAGAVSKFLGEISYPIYVLQIPVFSLVVWGAPKLLHGSQHLPAPWTGLLLLAALCGTCWFLAIRFDIPVRRRLAIALMPAAVPKEGVAL